jgi:DNA repair protein RadC
VVSSREIILQAVRSNAAAVILVHNHPSGEASPSPEDRHITSKIVQACRFVDVQVLDHIIVGKDQFFSFADQGLLT